MRSLCRSTIGFFFFCIITSGCMTVISQAEYWSDLPKSPLKDEFDPLVATYGGVYNGGLFIRRSVDALSSDVNKIVFVPAVLFDMPLSFVVDTVFLPMTIPQQIEIGLRDRPDEEELEISLPGDVAVRFASRSETAEFLGTRDAFVSAMSPFDRAVRMRSRERFSEAEFLEFVARQSRDFGGAEKRKLRTVVASIAKKFSAINLRDVFPAEITIVKTSGKEEGHAAYCRGNHIVLSTRMLRQGRGELEFTLTHELFHILSKNDRQLRAQLYEIVGFKPCDPVPFPESLRAKKITNPDAIENDFYTQVTVEGREEKVLPILLSSQTSYDSRRGKDLFDYLTLMLLAIEEKDGRWVPRYEGGEPVLLSLGEAPEYSERFKDGYGYILQPEEVLADQFVFMVEGSSEFAISQAMREVLCR